MQISTKKRIEALDVLQRYNGDNPYILMLKKDVFINKKQLNDFSVEYVLENETYQPREINKIIKIASWYGEKKKEDWNTDFTPEKIKITYLLGETSAVYHCYVKYRQSVPPVQAFIPKKAVLTNFLLEDYHNYNVDFDRYDRLSTAKDPNRKLREHQKEAVQFLLSRKKCVLADDMGLGKMEPVSSLIPTPSGYKKMGDIKVGDFVFGQDGKEHKVIEVFPHKNKEIYRVHFSDNTYADCGLEHLWVVRDKNMKTRKKGWKAMSLKEMIETGLTYNNNKRSERGLSPISKYEIPVTDAVEYEKKPYFIDPYVLGYCIGDANMCNGGINISIPDFEKESVTRIGNLLNENYHLKEDRNANCPRYRIVENVKSGKNLYIREIKRLGLDVHGNYKFIPEEYKLGSIEQRLSLLRGLMDSDGCIRENNKITFSTNSEKLASDVKEVVYSLGGIARVSSYDRRKSGKNIEYRVNIQIKYNPFLLKRKADKYAPTFKKYCTKHIVSAEYVRNEDAQCLYIDSQDHTYLTGKDYIVTHNTTSLTVAAIEGNFDSILIICPANLKTTWRDELLWYVPERDITIIEGYIGKTKSELEAYLGYGVGKSKMTVSELQEEARTQTKWRENRFVIINYDILGDFYEIPESRKKEAIETAYNNSPLLQFIANKKSLLIVDEAHELSNMKALRYKIIRDLIKRGEPDSIYLSTGTPITNDPLNYYNLLYLLEENITDDWAFYMKRYCGAIEICKDKKERDRWTAEFLKQKKKMSWMDLTDDEKVELREYLKKHCKMITIQKEPTNLDELRDRTSHIYLRRVKEDLDNFSIKKHVHEVFYSFTPIQWQEYSRLWAEYEEMKTEENPDVELNKQLIEGAIYRNYCANQMIPNTIKMVKKFVDEGHKVVVICCYDEELYTLRDNFGDSCVIYNGKMTPKAKDKAKHDFINNQDKKVMICNLIAAGVGLTLVVSDVMIFNNFDYVYANNVQAEDRIFRIGQKKDVDIYYQMFIGTQYEHVWKTSLRKKALTETVIKKEDEK